MPGRKSSRSGKIGDNRLALNILNADAVRQGYLPENPAIFLNWFGKDGNMARRGELFFLRKTETKIQEGPYGFERFYGADLPGAF
jgi:hypothetical protein